MSDFLYFMVFEGLFWGAFFYFYMKWRRKDEQRFKKLEEEIANLKRNTEM